MPLQVINMPTKLMHGKVKESSATVNQYMTCTPANFAFKLHPFGLYNACAEKFIAKVIVVIFSSLSYSCLSRSVSSLPT